jgi:predicted MFS family arabinose efflux permease
LPVGAALGYVLGGLLGASVGWRNAFFIVGFPGLILAFLLMRLKDPRKTQEKSKYSIKELTSVLRSSQSYLFATFGYCAYTFVVGGIAHWIPSFIQRTYGLSELSANTLFGGIAVGSGLFGTLAGGYLGDHLDKKSPGGHLRISAISMLFALPFFLVLCTVRSIKYFCDIFGADAILFFSFHQPNQRSTFTFSPIQTQKFSHRSCHFCMSHVG